MRRVYQATSVSFLAFSFYVLAESRKLNYWADYGPGPGFFPFWLGAILMLLSAIWLFTVSTRPTEPMDKGFVPERSGILRLLSALVALIVFTAVVEVVGFQLTMLAFMIFMLVVLGRQNMLVTLSISLIISFGLFYLFQQWLDVRLPYSNIEVLRNLGL